MCFNSLTLHEDNVLYNYVSYIIYHINVFSPTVHKDNETQENERPTPA